MKAQRIIYKGSDQSNFASFNLTMAGHEVKCYFSDFEKLTAADIDKQLLDNLVQQNQWTADNQLRFKNANGLPIYTAIKNQHRIFIACGELQPALYALYLEGIVAPQSEPQASCYQLISIATDTETMGCYPQVKDFYNPPSKAIYSDRNYARNHKYFLNAEIDLSIFELSPSAKKTDFIAAQFLSSNGFFIRQSVKEILTKYDIPLTKIFTCTAYQNDKPEQIYFLQVLESNNIDYDKSTFLISGGMHNTIHETIRFDSIEALRQKKTELVRTPERPSLEPQNIVLKKQAEIIKMPGTIDFYISPSLQQQFAKAGLTGYALSPASITIC